MTHHNVHNVYDGLFNSASGKKVSLKTPDVDMICGWDISKGLAYTARFGGQTTHFYSVAQHSVLVKYLAPQELKKAALLHDASEAYLGDVIKPLKVIVGRSYTDIEESFMAVIGSKFGVLRSEFEAIKEYDRQALEMEHEAFQKGHIHDWADWWKLNIGTFINVWPPDFAFKQYYQHLVSTFGEEAVTA